MPCTAVSAIPPSAAPLDALPPALETLPNGVRLVAIPMPWRRTVSLSVFLRTGSVHESRLHNGISHVVEHMAFKGTRRRDCQRINLDAERLGAEVNAHTDKDHTAFHIEGLPQDLPAFVELLADIVLDSTFPADELERERQVIEHELTEVEDDPEQMAYWQFDRACYGEHPVARPVIGNRANLRRLAREHLLEYVQRQYTGCNLIVGVAGPVDLAMLRAAVADHFARMPAGEPNRIEAPSWVGGVRLRRLGGSPQCHTVLGFPCPPLGDDAHRPYLLAASLLGEGMSSPLLDEIRERRGLAYHTACSADVLPLAGQFVIEAATEPDQAETFLEAVDRLLASHAQGIDPVALERARNQIAVRTLRGLEQPSRRLEAAALELFELGRIRDPMQGLAAIQSIGASEAQQVFERLRQQPAAVGLAGNVPERARTKALALFGGAG